MRGVVSVLNNVKRKARSALLFGEFFADAFRHLIDGNFFAELINLVVFDDAAQAEALGDFPANPQRGGEFLFGEQHELKFEVAALFGPAGDARLTHENEAGKQDAFECENHIEDRKWSGIKRFQRREAAAVDRQPEKKGYDVKGDEGEAADETRYRIADSFVPGAAGEEVTFVLGDEFDVLLDGAV
jgi:hypothetical protein